MKILLMVLMKYLGLTHWQKFDCMRKALVDLRDRS